MGIDSIKQILIEKLSAALKIDADRISHDAPVAEYGVDSIIGVDLIRTINETLQIDLETMALFEHSTVEQLAQYIADNWPDKFLTEATRSENTIPEINVQEAEPSGPKWASDNRFLKIELAVNSKGPSSSVEVSQVTPKNEKTDVEAIAIIGMSGRFAGSESLEQFWGNLEQGKSLIGKVTRWSESDCVTAESAGSGYCSHGSFIDSIDLFDPAFFRIPAAEAVYMDPQQRLFLEESWKALEDAGYAGNSVHETRCGIYVGCGTSGYGTLLAGELPAHAFWGNSQSIIPARLAYHLNLQGPAIAVDTACSSSLVSVHLACQGLWSGEMDMALAGGICLHTTPAFYHVANRAHMLSPEGECRSFDASANGFVPGEGVGVVVLKRLRDALRDRDHIHGVIAGTGINQDGTSNGLIAPNARAQEKLERSVYERFKINPESIQVIEAHGTGTIVGDSIEWLAISRAFGEYTDRKQFCALGTVKTNIGHTGPASGVAGILKLLLAMKHRQIPPSLHFKSGNPAIDLKSGAFYVNADLKDWKVEDRQLRRGAVSSFGFSGTNAHLIIEEPPAVESMKASAPGYMVVLSARTAEQLRQQARNLAEHLNSETDVSINDLAYTLLVGRMHFSHRMACVAKSQTELAQMLEQWIATGTANQVCIGEVPESRIRENVSLKKFGGYCIRECQNATDSANYLENLTAIAELYVKGYSLDYRLLFPEGSGRIPLPTYPFARDRYWFATDTPAQPANPIKINLPARVEAAISQALPKSDLGCVSHENEEPVTDTERQLIEIWAEVLGIEPANVGVDANLFELGGQSLLATQLMARVRDRLGVELPLTALFEYTSVAQVAELIAKKKKSDVRTIQQADRKQLKQLPLSFAQERVWFFEQLEPGSGRYNVPVAVTVNAAFDIDLFEQAVNVVIARHENLRTTFPSHAGHAQQTILDTLDFKVERIDLTYCTNNEEQHKRAKDLCRADATMPFDLSRGPLIRGKVLRMGEHENILMLNMHHIITDGWSMGVFLKETDVIMADLSHRRQVSLPPLEIQYADYAVWQRKHLEETGILKKQLTYWQEKLAGVSEKLELPTDFPRPRVRNFVGATHEFLVNPDLTAKLKRMAERKGATLFMILLAGFKVLLYRYSGQSDICAGTLVANRQYEQMAKLIGVFVNMLALRSQVDGDDTFSALLSQVKTTCLEAYENQDAPFEKVVGNLGQARNAAANPIFQVMLVLHNIAMMDPRFPRYEFENKNSELDLTVQFIESPKGLEASFECSTELFKPATMARMAKHFVALCQAITASPTARIRDLDFLSEAETHQLLIDFNQTFAESPREKRVHDFFAEQARRNPEKIAMRFGEQALKYQELYHKGWTLAVYLQSLGVKPDSIVGVCFDRSLEMLVAIMAVVMSGAAYLLADPACPDDDLEYMLHDSRANTVLTEKKFRNKVTSLLSDDVKLVALDQQWPEISRITAELKATGVELSNEVNANNLCCLIYMSDSTGRPKGVLVEHRALVNTLYWAQRQYALTCDDVVLGNTSNGFDPPAWEWFWPLMAGASVVLTVPDGGHGIDDLEKLINRYRVTTLHLSPSLLHSFLEHTHGNLGTIRHIFSCGEGLNKQLVDLCRTRFANAQLHALYEPMRGAAVATAYDCSQLEHSFVPIGKPINNTQIYMLDENNRPQPIGVPGELYIAGDGLARGYMDRPELTRERFVNNPFQPGTRMFKTGELARWLDDGNVQYLGKSRQCFPPAHADEPAEEINHGDEALSEVTLQSRFDEKHEVLAI